MKPFSQTALLKALETRSGPADAMHIDRPGGRMFRVAGRAHAGQLTACIDFDDFSYPLTRLLRFRS